MDRVVCKNCGGDGYLASVPMKTAKENCSYIRCDECRCYSEPRMHEDFQNPPIEQIEQDWKDGNIRLQNWQNT